MKHDREESAAILRSLEVAYRSAIERGFLGPREEPRLRERHLDDAVGLSLIRAPVAGERWVDLGSGAGLPGLPLAACFPGTEFTLVDANQRRLTWVAQTANDLRLRNVTVVHSRLEDYGHTSARSSFEVAVARALGPLPVVAELGLPLLRTGGLLIVPRGEPDPTELAEATRACDLLHGMLDRTVANPSSEAGGLVVLLTKLSPTPSRYPRRAGVPSRKPLGAGHALPAE